MTYFFKLIFIPIFLILLSKENSFSKNSEPKDTSNYINQIDNSIEFIKENRNHATDSFLILAKKTLNLSYANNYEKGIILCYKFIGDIFYNKNLNDSAYYYYKLGIKNAGNNYDLLANIYWKLSNVYRITGHYSAALEYSLKLKDLIESKKTRNFEIYIYNLLGLNYQSIMEYDLALENFQESARLAMENGDEGFSGVIYANIGSILFDQGKIKKSLDYFKRGVQIEEKYELFQNAGNSYTAIAEIYIKNNKLDSAQYFLSKGITYLRKNNYEPGIAKNLIIASRFYYLQNDLKNSEIHLKETIEIANRLKLNNILSEAYQLSANINAKKNNYKKAYYNYEKFFEIYNQLYSIKDIHKVKALEHKLIQEQKESELIELELSKQKTISTLLLVVVILAVIIGVIAIAFSIHTKRSNKNLQKAKLKAEESDKLKSQFLQTISHEIRTPLNGIIGFSDMILSEDLSDKELKDINILIHKNSYDLTSTIENLVDIAHLTTNQYHIEKSNFDFNSLLNNIFNIVTDDLLLKNKPELKLIFDNPGNIIICSDKIILQKILLHLIKNAISYTDKGSVHLGCKLVDSKLNIFIKDTGIGISKEKLEIIFSPFRQADENINIKVGGTGLGLSIVSKFIELLNGEIRVESEVNKGSTFYITLPTN